MLKRKRVEVRNQYNELFDLGEDCLFHIIDYMDTKSWIRFSYTCSIINKLKKKKEIMINKQRTCDNSKNGSILLTGLIASKGTLYNVSLNGFDFDELTKTVTDKIFDCFKGTIHTLDLSHNIYITDDMLEFLQGTIHTLHMEHCILITDIGLSYLQGSIHTLDIRNCRNITNKGIQYLQGTIQDLSMRCPLVTDEAFEFLKGIHTLQLEYMKNITDAALAYLKGSIRKLSLYYIDNMTDDCFKYVGDTLQELEIREFNVGYDIGNLFIHLNHVHTLKLTVREIVSTNISCIKQMPALQKVTFNNCMGLKETELQELVDNGIEVNYIECKITMEQITTIYDRLRHI